MGHTLPLLPVLSEAVMPSENIASGSLPQWSLLSIADDMVRVLQSLITILSDYYEKSLSSNNGFSISGCMSSLEFVQDELHQKLAMLWPCEKQYVAVLGCTGCGKSTLLNLLLSLMCSSGSTYTQGIRADSARAVLRDTARVYVTNSRSCPNRAEIQHEDAPEKFEASPIEADNHKEYVPNGLLVKEQDSFEGVLGICCAQDKQSYMGKHIPYYDAHPFILQHGRMGDAGTTKVTSVEYGPKFVGHIRWMTRKKLRRKLRDLRQILDGGQCTTMQGQPLSELKEFWHSVRQLVGLPSTFEIPTEELINRVVNDLGVRERLLDKEERIETSATEGYMVDRIFVREGIKKMLQQKLGKLIEDLRIEVPVASFEGGISLLDVPGTNDPRVLHQRETRDAIDRTSLILLVLDKSVMDSQTQASLAESLLLERMLMDETAICSLVVVGIAEKDTKKGQSPKDVLASFDPKENILKNLEKVFRQIASRLCKSKRIQKKEHALKRIKDLFTSSITLIPVLPFLCVSLHLSPSNPELHQTFCQSKGQSSCPLSMSKEELRERCMETNIPHLLEKLHSVRVPPTEMELSKSMTSTLEGLKLLTKQNMVDSSYTEFLETERAQALRVSFQEVCFQSDGDSNKQSLEEVLCQYADECKLEGSDINDICNMVGKDLQSQLQTGRFLLGPFILRGFCPEVIGQKANHLICGVDKEAKCFTDEAYGYLCSLRGEVRLNADYLKMEEGTLSMALVLHDQLTTKWKLSLHRLRAKFFCGGIDGGLLGQVRESLRKAYDGALKHLSKELKKWSKSRDLKEILRSALESNALGTQAARVAKTEVEKACDKFWKNLSQSVNSEIQFLWKSWQMDVDKLAKSARNSLQVQREGERNPRVLDEMKAGDQSFGLFQKSLEAKEEELQALMRRLCEGAGQSKDGFEYGYSLLQSDSVVDMMGYKGESLIADNPRPGCERSTHMLTETLGNQTRLIEPMQGGGICEEDMFSKDTHLACVKADISRDKLPASSSGAGNITRVGFLGRTSRKAQVLSDDESFKLQKRESSAKRLRK